MPRDARSQRELEKRIFHLKTVYDVSQGLPILRGTEAILKNLLLMVMGTFGSMAGLTFLADPKSGRLQALSGRGLTEGAMKSLTADLAEAEKDISACFGSVVEQGEEESYFAAPGEVGKLLAALGLTTWAPFRLNDEIHGGIALGAKLSGEAYTADDHELLGTLAAQGAMAVENTRLLERMKQEEIARVNFARYLSPHVVDQVLNNNLQVNLGGERKTVTVLFADIRDFTTLAETCPPDHLVTFLNKYFTSMAACIFESQGSIDKYIGDAVMAVFGSFIPLENTPQAAVQAAVLMMQIVSERCEEWRPQQSALPIRIGIGITTGEVFLGNIGSPEQMEFTVIGDVVNVASRFSGVARPGQILVDRETMSRLGDAFRYQELPHTHVKGKAQKVEVFEIVP